METSVEEETSIKVVHHLDLLVMATINTNMKNLAPIKLIVLT